MLYFDSNATGVCSLGSDSQWVSVSWGNGLVPNFEKLNRFLAMMTSSNGNIFRVTGSFVRGIHRSPGNSPHKGPVTRDLDVSLILAKASSWINRRVAGDLRRYDAHCDVIVMLRVHGGWLCPDAKRAPADHQQSLFCLHKISDRSTMKPVYNDHRVGYLSAFWSSSRWPRAT